MKIEAALMVVCGAGSGALVTLGRVSWAQCAAFLGGYAFSMLFLSPDLDLADSCAYRRWGLLRWIWRPYAVVFRHRQLSHHLVWGPLSRVGYLAVIGSLVLFAVSALAGSPGVRMQLSVSYVLPVCLGIYLPNMEHIIADWLCSRWRKVHRRL